MRLTIIIILAVIGFSCERTTNQLEENRKKDSIALKIELVDSVITQPIDSLILVYNSLPRIKFYESYFMKGVIDHKENTYYPILFQELAALGSPDSIQDGYLDTTHGIFTIGLGDNIMNMSFFKDSLSKCIITVIRTNRINQFYGIDSHITILKSDSLVSWKNITDDVINQEQIFSNYTNTYKDSYILNDLFLIEMGNSGKTIRLKINKGKKKWDCQNKNLLICQLRQSQLEDSLILNWSSEEGKFRIMEP